MNRMKPISALSPMQKMFGTLPKALINILLFAYSLSCIVPILWMINSSLRTNGDFMSNILGLATQPEFENFTKAFTQGNLGRHLFNSLYLTFISVAIGTIMAFVVAYFLSRFKFKGRNFVYYLFIVGMIVPTLSLLIPVFMQFKLLGLRNNWFTLLFPYVAYMLPMSIILFESFIKTIPKELDEAARIDGANTFKVMFKVIFPLCRPMLSVVLILNFMYTWNEFPFALVLLKGNDLTTISVGIRAFNQMYNMDYTLFMAALVIATIPIILVYSALSKRIMEGMTIGAMKG